MANLDDIRFQEQFNGDTVTIGISHFEDGGCAVYEHWENSPESAWAEMVKEDKGECPEDTVALFIRAHKDMVRSVELEKTSAAHVRLFELRRDEDRYYDRIITCINCGWEASLEGDTREERKWEAKLDIVEADMRRTRKELAGVILSTTKADFEEIPF